MEFNAGNTVRLLLLSLLGLSCAVIKGGSRIENSLAEEPKRVVETALDKLSIELARCYVTQKRTRFPKQVKTIASLEAYLNRLYPNESHELRLAVQNLRRCKEGFSSYEGTVKMFLKNGLRMYAVNLDGKPLPYDRMRIEAIISEAVAQSSQLKPGFSEDEVGKTKMPGETFGFKIDSMKQKPLMTIGIIAAASLGLWCLLSALRRGKKQEQHILDLAASYHIAESSRQVPAVENKAVMQAETRVIESQRPESLFEHLASPPLAADHEGKSYSSSDKRRCPDQWLVVRTSVPGKSHTENNPPIPCQDSNHYDDIGEGWGIAVVCDGAGSKEYSHYGSRFVAQQAGHYFRKIVEENDWQRSNILPSQDQWQEVSKRAFAKIRDDMEGYAREQGLDSNSLSCTVIVVIHSPNGVLTTHIGDGRAAFCNSEQEWKALIKPHKGEEANTTFFITSIDWSEPDNYIESVVVKEKPSAFTLMSDGCESHSFEVNIFDEQEQKYKDLNSPYPKFFQPLVATLRNLHRSCARREEIEAKWERFIESGSEKLKNEPDDKTMILGVLLD